MYIDEHITDNVSTKLRLIVPVQNVNGAGRLGRGGVGRAARLRAHFIGPISSLISSILVI